MMRMLPVTIYHDQTMRVVVVLSLCYQCQHATQMRWVKGGSISAHTRDLAS